MSRPYAEVIGDPIAHSKSPLIHNFWLEKLGVDADYRATHVKPEGLEGYFEDRRADPDWRGCNVTIPHKVSVLDHIADMAGLKETIGAANTVVRYGPEILATNTDAAGFFAPISAMELSGKEAIVIGAGGAARAVLFALSQLGIGHITLLNRTPMKGAALLAKFGLKGDALSLDAELPPASLLVNASPLGMEGQDSLEIDLSTQPDDAVIYDLVYAPLETGLLAQAKARGLDCVDGLEMLIGQAAVAFEMFFQAGAPREGDAELRELLMR